MKNLWIPNDWLDKAVLTMQPAELKLVMVIANQSCNHEKGLIQLSLSQLQRMTGLSRHTCIKAIRQACIDGWIRQYKSGQISYYELVDKRIFHE